MAARQAAKRPAGNRTVRAELALLHRMTVRAGEALEFDLIPQWRMPRFRIVERHRQVPTPAQLAAVWVRLEGPPLVALALCTLTGMRASEAFRAQADDVNAEDATIRLRGRKAGDELVVAMTDTLAALLPRTGRLVRANEYHVSWALERASRDAGGPRLSGPGNRPPLLRNLGRRARRLHDRADRRRSRPPATRCNEPLHPRGGR